MSSRIEGNSVPSQLAPHESEADVCVPATQARPQPKSTKNDVVDYRNQKCADIVYRLDNPNADPKAQGSTQEQVKQVSSMGLMTKLATDRATGTNVKQLEAEVLKHLDATPPEVSAPTESANYNSTMKGVGAKAAFDYFVKNPNAVFGASGITLHPPTTELKDGARVFLAEPGVTPPVYAPIEVHIDEAARTVRITTLDGHPLRGVNQFSFDENVKGDCELRQSSLFQLSSFASELGSKGMAAAQKAGVPGVQNPIERQHQIWERAHADVADHAGRR